MSIRNIYSLESFYQNISARKFVYPTIILKYFKLLSLKNKSLNNFLMDDFKDNSHMFLNNPYIKFSPKRFIKNSIKRKTITEERINRKMFALTKANKVKRVSRNLKDFKIIKKKRISRVPKKDLDDKSVIIKTPTKREKQKITTKNKIKQFGQLQPSRLITRFRNLLSKKGKLYKTERLLKRVHYIIKLALRKKGRFKLQKLAKKKLLRNKDAALINKAFIRVLASARPFITLKIISKSKQNVVYKPVPISLQRSTSLAQRTLLSSITKRSERFLSKRIALEFIAIYKKKSNSTQNTFAALRKEIRRSYALL